MPASPPADETALRVRALRDQLGVSQEQLAQRLQVSFATVNRWEGGRHRMSAAGRKRFELIEAGMGSTPFPLPRLPDSLSTFVGRADAIDELVSLIARQPLVSLTGPPGVGKTRLAVEVGRRLSANLPVVYLDVAAIDQRATDDDAGLDRRVTAALSSNTAALVVLDGVEPCVDRVRELLGRLLTGAGAVRVLVTSQQALRISGEQVWQVPPLGCPPTAPAAPTEADVLDSEAGQLFVDRARRVTPGFEIAGTDAAAVAQLCRGVDGLPHALEILAGWSGVLSIGQLVERQDELLLPEPPTQPDPANPAADGLRGAFAASYARLDPDGQSLVQQLSTFAGAFTIDDAAAVTQLGAADLVGSLRRLVDHSWLVVVPGRPVNAYRMTSTLRHFALGQLVDGSAERAVRTRHASHFAELAGASEHGLAGVDRTEWVERMTRAGIDVDAALGWAADDGDELLGLAMSASLWLWWLTTGRLGDGRRWVGDFLRRAQMPPANLAARAQCTAAVLAVESGDYATAVEYASLAYDGFERLCDTDGAARAATALGSAQRYLGNQASARQHFELAMNFRRDLGDDRGLASALNNMALLALDTGDLAATRALFEESLLVKRRLGEPRTVAIGLANLSDVLIRAGQLGQALESLREAADIAADLADTQLLATIACNLGDVASGQGEYAEAVEHYEMSIEAYRASGGAHDLVPALVGMARGLQHLGRTHDAMVRLREAEALSTMSANSERLAEIRAAFTDVGQATTIALPGGLTARQAQILQQVATGASNKSIAVALHISVATVERHLATIYRKLGLHGRVDAARYALKHGLAAAADPEAAAPARTEYMVPRIPNRL